MARSSKRLFIGLISGTSMDGIDAALIDFADHSLIEGLSCPYSSEARNYLNAVLAGELMSLKHYSQLNTLLGREFAQASLELLKKAQIPASSIQAIGSHGQTLCHDPRAEIPYTLQLACAHTIAELTGITVVADFRTRDLVVGGQGAPFAPIYHQALFREQRYPLAVVNIGGIANLSYLADEATFWGYDLGPGNCLIDAWIQKNLGVSYDQRGEWAASGRVITSLLDQLLADPYFQLKPPKSLDKTYFSLDWLAQHLQKDYAQADVQATLLLFTAQTIAQGIQAEKNQPSQLLICGGGVHNSLFMKTLAALLPNMKVQSTAAININPDFIEAQMFAWFAEKALSRRPLDLSRVTGAKRATFLGAIYPALAYG